MITIIGVILFLKDLKMCLKSLRLDKDTDYDYLALGSNAQSRSKQ